MGILPLKIRRTGGVKLPGCRNTAGLIIIPMALPAQVRIPMTSGEGGRAVPVVEPGDKVRLGQLIGRSSGGICVPVHSSVSGTVTAIEKGPSLFCGEDIFAVISCDGRQELDPQIITPDPEDLRAFLLAVHNSGIVCLGGDAYPLGAKLAAALDAKSDTLIINGVESEPFLTVDYMTMLSHTEDVVNGAKLIMHWLGMEKCIIAVSSAHRDAAAAFGQYLDGSCGISVAAVKDLYPYGAESVLVKELTGRNVPPCKNAVEAGCLVCSVNTVVKLQHYMLTGLPLVTKNITVDGSAVFSHKNLEVPVGTSVADVLAFCGGASSEIKLILADGVMKGRKVPSEDCVVSKSTGALLFFDESFASSLKETACIRCGRCFRACPAGLMPMAAADALDLGHTERLPKLKPQYCIDCGACTYVCPARRRLSEKMAEAKAFCLQAAKGGSENGQ